MVKRPNEQRSAFLEAAKRMPSPKKAGERERKIRIIVGIGAVIVLLVAYSHFGLSATPANTVKKTVKMIAGAKKTFGYQYAADDSETSPLLFYSPPGAADEFELVKYSQGSNSGYGVRFNDSGDVTTLDDSVVVYVSVGSRTCTISGEKWDKKDLVNDNALPMLIVRNGIDEGTE